MASMPDADVVADGILERAVAVAHEDADRAIVLVGGGQVEIAVAVEVANGHFVGRTRARREGVGPAVKLPVPSPM